MDILISIIAVILLLVGIFGTIFPILPGSILSIITLISWAWILGSTASWWTGIAGAVIAVLGMSASLILTGRTMKKEQVPNAPIVFATACAILGFFLIPFVGIFLGFAAGLLGAEFYRTRDFKIASRTSLQTLKSMGIGMVIECICAITALGMLLLGILLHFSA